MVLLNASTPQQIYQVTNKGIHQPINWRSAIVGWASEDSTARANSLFRRFYVNRQSLSHFEKLTVASWLVQDGTDVRLINSKELLTVFGLQPGEITPYLEHLPCTDVDKCGRKGHLCTNCVQLMGVTGQAWDLTVSTTICRTQFRLILGGHLAPPRRRFGYLGPVHNCGQACVHRKDRPDIQ